MSSLTIKNDSSLPIIDAMEYMKVVMKSGRISETRGRKHFCHITVFDLTKKRELFVGAHITPADTDVFHVWEQKRK